MDLGEFLGSLLFTYMHRVDRFAFFGVPHSVNEGPYEALLFVLISYRKKYLVCSIYLVFG